MLEHVGKKYGAFWIGQAGSLRFRPKLGPIDSPFTGKRAFMQKIKGSRTLPVVVGCLQALTETTRLCRSKSMHKNFPWSGTQSQFLFTKEIP